MRTILIIDDDIAIGNMEQEVLERVGYTTRRAYSGTEALLIHLLLLRHSITEVARGLGLSIAKQLTEKLGGSIRAEYGGGKLQIKLSLPQY